MLNFNFELEPRTEQKMRRILDLHSDKESFFQDIINAEIYELKNGIHNMEIDLREFEKKYRLSTEDFYRQFNNGELDDREDFIIWAGLNEMRSENNKRLAELE